MPLCPTPTNQVPFSVAAPAKAETLGGYTLTGPYRFMEVDKGEAAAIANSRLRYEYGNRHETILLKQPFAHIQVTVGGINKRVA